MSATMPRSLMLAFVAAALCACASGPRFDRDSYDDRVAPREAARAADEMRGRGILWGGLIVAATNLDRGTEVEILAYPLGRDQHPDLSRAPLGRFLAATGDFLETVDFAPGRLVTVAGTLAGSREGQVGEARYLYPVVATDAARIHLWPQDGGRRGSSSFNFGLGLGIGL